MEISAIIPTFNGYALTEKCVEALLKETPLPEIIVVDNASTDKSVASLRQQFATKIKVISLDKNRGPGHAWNSGAKAAKGDILLFLDNDTEVQPETLSAITRLFRKDTSIGAAQCKLVLKADPNRLDCVGEYIAPTGFLVQRAPVGSPDRASYNHEVEIFAAKSAAIAIRRNTFVAIDGFDEDYFQYVIETDICWRIWLAGWRIVFAPNTSVWHVFGGTERVWPDKYKRWNIKYQASRNSIWTLYKNLSTPSLWRMLPVHCLLWLAASVWIVLHGNIRGGQGIVNGLWAGVTQLPDQTWKRKNMQARRRISDADLFRRVMHHRSILYFIKKMALARQLPIPRRI